ncbi:MAG: TetR/AcrR family transcriptional regulator [Clostridia bacterium]
MKKDSSDHRTRVTRMLIRRAFTELLRQKPIQSISIKELCELAGINRGTFYSHYDDIYDLLKQIEDEMMADFIEALKPLLTAEGPDFNPIDISAGIFQCLKDNSDLCTVTLGSYGDKSFALRLINLGREGYMDAYSKHFKGATPKQIEYCYAFISSGCIGILQKWLDDGMVTSAGELAKTAESLMLYGLGYLKK